MGDTSNVQSPLNPGGGVSPGPATSSTSSTNAAAGTASGLSPSRAPTDVEIAAFLAKNSSGAAAQVPATSPAAASVPSAADISQYFIGLASKAQTPAHRVPFDPVEFSLSATNTFADAIAPSNDIPTEITDHMRRGFPFPLPLFSSKALSDHRIRGLSYPTMSHMVNNKKEVILDTRAEALAEPQLTKVQWFDCHRNLEAAFGLAFSPEHAADIHDYVGTIQDLPEFRTETDWPAVLRFDIAARTLWCSDKSRGGKFRFARHETFLPLAKFVRELEAERREEEGKKREEFLKRDQAEQARKGRTYDRAGDRSERGRDRRSASPARGGRFPRRSSGGGPSGCCVLCGDRGHNAAHCPTKADNSCSFDKGHIFDNNSSQEICFRYNVGPGCDTPDTQTGHGAHKCSVCLRTGHGAQQHKTRN